MARLYIEPKHGKLGAVIEALDKQGYTAQVVGYGYPPIFVTEDQSAHDEIKRIALEADAEAKFQPYRADLIDGDELADILGKFDLADFRRLCLALDINFGSLPSSATNNLSLLTVELIERYRKTNSLSELVDAAYKIHPHAF